MNFKRRPKSKKDRFSDSLSTSLNQEENTSCQGESVRDLSRREEEQVKDNSDSRALLEGLNNSQVKASYSSLAKDKETLIDNSNTKRTLGSKTRSFRELARQETLISNSSLNDNLQSDKVHKLGVLASSSIQALDSDSDSTKAVELSEKDSRHRQQVSSDCCYCNCHLKGNYKSKGTSEKRRRSSSSLIMSKSNQLIIAYFLAELVGTFLLVLIGDGAIASYVVSRHQVDLFTACFAFGVGAMIATFASAKISGAHINPAASLAFALEGKLRWKLLPVYICAQYLGGFLAALVLFVNYSEAINSLDGGTRSSFGSTNSTGQIFATYPAAYVSIWGSLLDQIIGTAVLLFSICAVTDKNNAGLEDRHQPLCVAFTIGIICVAFSANCGAIFNPARDLAPRLLTLIFGYSKSFEPIQSIYWLSAGVVGPHIGAIVGVFGYKFLIGNSLIQKQELELKAISGSRYDEVTGQ